MARAREYIDLTSALTLAAFGLELTGDAFAKAMSVEHFGMERTEALARFGDALISLQRAVLAGDLVLVGRFVKSSGQCTEELTSPLPSLALTDYAAFDYTINGLRHGRVQLLWFSANENGYVQPKLVRHDFYRDVQVVRGQVLKFLGVGKSPALQTKRMPPLPEPNLRQWYEKLSRAEQGQSKEKIYQLAVEQHPTFKVSRERIRVLVGTRPRGRPPKSATKNAAD